MIGTFAQNEDYCSKQSRLHHYGVPFQGKGGRTDRNEYYALLKSGKSDLELMDEDFNAYARFRNATADYRQLTPPTVIPGKKLELYLFFGPPGTGKTEFAYQQLGQELYRIPVSDQFWLTQTSSGKKLILVDEFRANMKLWMLLQLLDSKLIEVQKKGGFQWWYPDIVVITTNRSIHDWYRYEKRDMEKEALFRRFDYGGVYRFEKNRRKVPKPFEIDIWNPLDFEYPYIPFCLRPHECIPVVEIPIIIQDHFEADMPGMIPEANLLTEFDDISYDNIPGMLVEEFMSFCK